MTGILVMAFAAAADSGLTTGSAITDGCISEAAAAYPLYRSIFNCVFVIEKRIVYGSVNL